MVILLNFTLRVERPTLQTSIGVIISYKTILLPSKQNSNPGSTINSFKLTSFYKSHLFVIPIFFASMYNISSSYFLIN